MKIVMVINNELAPGLAANTAAVLGITLGNHKTDIIGPDCRDKTGRVHKGITRETIPILQTDGANLKSLYQKSLSADQVEVIGFNRIAQKCRTYPDYEEKLSRTEGPDLSFSGLCLLGPKKQIASMTGSFALYR